MIRQRVSEVTRKATQKQALKRVIAGGRLLPPNEQGISFILFSAEAQYRRPGGYIAKPQNISNGEVNKMEFFDPFAQENVEEDLFVSKVFDDHFLILNKFAVVDEHLVLATVDFVQQETPLTFTDIRALWKSMDDLDAFGFFNCGYESGASQPHKHMQLISYSSMKLHCNLNMPPLLQYIENHVQGYPSNKVIEMRELPFHHYVTRFDFGAIVDHDTAANHIRTLYTEVLQMMDAGAIHGDRPMAYNLLVTKSFMFVIPRRMPAFEGIEINSIGFVGSFFERNDEQLNLFKTLDAMEILKGVTFPQGIDRARLSN